MAPPRDHRDDKRSTRGSDGDHGGPPFHRIESFFPSQFKDLQRAPNSKHTSRRKRKKHKAGHPNISEYAPVRVDTTQSATLQGSSGKYTNVEKSMPSAQHITEFGCQYFGSSRVWRKARGKMLRLKSFAMLVYERRNAVIVTSHDVTVTLKLIISTLRVEQKTNLSFQHFFSFVFTGRVIVSCLPLVALLIDLFVRIHSPSGISPSGLR